MAKVIGIIVVIASVLGGYVLSHGKIAALIQPFEVMIIGGAALGATHAAQKKPLMVVLVVGETGRADHFALNGYDRNTTPELAARQVLNWTNVHSCGTSTLASAGKCWPSLFNSCSVLRMVMQVWPPLTICRLSTLIW